MRDLYFYHELEDQYEEMLNECYEPVAICGFEYDQGYALRELDSIAFSCGVSDWVSEEFEELRYEDLTDEEREYYLVGVGQIVYVRGEM